MTREEAIEYAFRARKDSAEDAREFYNIAISALRAEPRKHGRWILNRQGNWACSLCGNDPYHDNMKNMHYCPNCGATMYEVEE